MASERGTGSRKRSMAVVKGKSCATMIDKQLQRVMIRSVSIYNVYNTKLEGHVTTITIDLSCVDNRYVLYAQHFYYF